MDKYSKPSSPASEAPSSTSSAKSGHTDDRNSKTNVSLVDEWKSLTNHKKRVAARKPRWVPSEYQLQVLESCWKGNPYPTSLETTCIAETLLKNSVTSTQVHRWFKHRREYLSKKGQFVCRGAAERFNSDQLHILESEFAREPFPNASLRERLAQTCGVNAERVRNWFNARRLTSMSASASKGSAISVEDWLEREQEAERRDSLSRADSFSPPSSVYSAGSPTASKTTVPSLSGDCMLDDESAAACLLYAQGERRRSIVGDSHDAETTNSKKRPPCAPLQKKVPEAKRAKTQPSEVEPIPMPVTGYSLPASVLEGRDQNGFTPLLAAASNENVEEAEFLVRSGADVNAMEPKYRVTPLMMASATGNRALAKAILDSNRCDVDAVNGHGSNALHLAVQYRHTEIVSLLLEAGAQVNHMWEGVTCLHVAVSRGDSTTCELLLKNKADANLAEKHGTTPLMAAAQEGNVNAIRALLSNGAKINQDDTEGHTALMAAASNGQLDALNVLLQNGASAVICDKHGRDAAYHAEEKGQKAVLEVLKSQRSLADTSLNVFADLIGQAA